MTADDTRLSSGQASLSNILLFTALNADLMGLPEQMEKGVQEGQMGEQAKGQQSPSINVCEGGM